MFRGVRSKELSDNVNYTVTIVISIQRTLYTTAGLFLLDDVTLSIHVHKAVPVSTQSWHSLSGDTWRDLPPIS